MKSEDDHILGPGREDCFPSATRQAASGRRLERTSWRHGESAQDWMRRAAEMEVVEIRLTGDHARALMELAGKHSPQAWVECLIEVASPEFRSDK